MKYSCYYIICFGCLWALLNTVVLFLGLTYKPEAQPKLFFSCVRVSQKKKIKQSPIDLKLHGTYFRNGNNPGDLE